MNPVYLRDLNVSYFFIFRDIFSGFHGKDLGMILVPVIFDLIYDFRGFFVYY